MAKALITSIKNRTWEILDTSKSDDKATQIDDILLMSLILLNILAVILGSIHWIEIEYKSVLEGFETFSIVIFSIEYIIRVWACTSDHKYSKSFGRLRYLVTPFAVIDLIAIIPFYIPFLGIDLRVVRIFRLFRIFRIAKAARYITSLKLLGRVFKSKKEELIITSGILTVLVFVASTLMYFFESPTQPDKFPDIPSAMWWSVATLTTVGYGDVFPVTVEGKAIASIVAILGIGLFALPTGILGAGFVEEFQKTKKKTETQFCPHCGKEIK